DALLHRRRGAGRGRREDQRSRPFCRLPLRDAAARRAATAVTVRVPVPVARARRRDDRPGHRGRSRLTGGDPMNELYRYLTLAVTPEWRRLAERERASQKAEFVDAASHASAGVHSYSLVGTRADA